MIIKFSDLSRLRKRLANKKIVFAGGTFDLIHRGHIEYFKKIKKLGNIVVIAISSDKRVRQRKGNKRPIIGEKERLAVIDSFRYIDYSLLAPEPNKKKPVPTMRILEKLKPNIFISIDKRWLAFRDNIEKMGIQLKLISARRINSTTRLINRILKRYRN